VAVALAIRWDSRGIAALGIMGGLLAPVMVGAPSDLATLMVLFVAAASAAGVLVWRQWDWLAFGAFGVTTPQWIVTLFNFEARSVVLAVPVLFGVLGVAMAIGFDVRRSTDKLRAASVFLLALNAIVVGLSGFLALDSLGHPFMAKAWLAALSVAHIGAGIAGTRVKRASHDLVLVALGLGVALGDVAFGLLASGVALAIGWAALGALFAWLARRTRREHDAVVALAGVGGHLTLAMIRALAVGVEATGAAGDDITLSAMIGVAALAAGCFVSARLAEERWVEWRIVLDIAGLAALAYLSSIALDGGDLTLAWAAEAWALAQIAHRSGDRVALAGAAGFLGLALAEALVVTPPRVLIYGLDDPLPQILAPVAVALTAGRFAQLRLGGGRWPMAGAAGACAWLLYLASGVLMTGFQPDTTATAAKILDVGIRQEGQMLMSALWAVTGIAALVVGLRNDLRLVRYGALALILMATAKVFLFDLAALSSLYRVASFLALGLLLLVGAFIWQRTRPRPLPDLRSVNRPFPSPRS
jgi:uncharacterized membrane protein